MSSRMRYLEGWDVAPATDVFICRALRALRQRLRTSSGTVQSEILSDMFFLCSAETYRYNPTAATTHLLAIAQLVEGVGGLHRIQDHMLLETLVHGDILISVEQLAPPALPLTWDPGPFSPARWRRIRASTSLSSMGEAVSISRDEHAPSEDMAAIVNDVIQCIQVAQHTWPQLEPHKDDLQWIFLRYLSILHRLLKLQSTSWRAEVVRIALIMLFLMVMTDLGKRRSGKLLAPRLRLAIAAARFEDRSSWGGERTGLLVWALTIGWLAASGTGEEQWFLAQLVAAMDELQLGTEDVFRRLLRSYFFVESTQSARISVLAEELRALGALGGGDSTAFNLGENGEEEGEVWGR